MIVTSMQLTISSRRDIAVLQKESSALEGEEDVNVSNVRLHRDGLMALLHGCPSINVLGADSVQETQNVLRTTATDVALIDAPSPGASELVRALRKICARIRILAVGIRETASEVVTCAAAGIDGYVYQGEHLAVAGSRQAFPHHDFEPSPFA
jgi:DNA-binding NarL/FixJ family response regulator